MKKRAYIVLLLLISLAAQAQFKIVGEIKNYENQAVLIKTYDQGVLRLFARVETDSQGKFTYDFPQKYVGLIQLDFSVGGYQMVSDNHDIHFITDYLDEEHSIKYLGGINEKIENYNEYATWINIKEKGLKPLLTYYTPEDEFYKEVEKEIQRINAKTPEKFSDSEIQYYVDTKTILNNYDGSMEPEEELKKEIENHILNDGIGIEKFGFLPLFITHYVQYSMAGAQSKKEAEQLMKKNIDQLLESLGADTQRGQAVQIDVISLLSASSFKDLADYYTAKAEKLTCEITPELKKIITGNKNIQVGKKIPNIVFNEPVKGKKSLYDIKAKKKLILFWGSWCPHCQHEIPFIKDFYKQFKKEGGEIFAFAVDLTKKDYEEWVGDTDWYNYSDLLKWESPVIADFAVDGTPTFILVDKNNKILKTGSRISEFVNFK